jgi:sec-independent protein translocase protein TatA
MYKEVIMFRLGMPELIVVLIIALIIFGPSKLPSLGKGIGEAIRGLKKGLEGEPSKEDNKIEN